MRVVFLAHSFPRFPTDGAGSFLLRLARALADHDIDVTAVVPHARGLAADESLDGVTVHRYRYAPDALETLAYTGTMAEQVSAGLTGKVALAGLLAAGTRAAVAQARRARADIVHAHWWFPAGLAGVVVNRLLRIPLVTTSHGSDVRLARAIPGGARLLRTVARRSASFTTVSGWLAQQIRHLAPAADPVVAPMPVDVDLFSPGTATPRDRLLFVGRLNAQKGLDKLLRALPLTRPARALDVVGDGPLGADLRALATELGLEGRIVWHGAQPPARLSELYRRAAALVVPSIDEGLGLVAVEAQLSGTPVIAFASGGLVDVIDDGRTGLLVEPDDIDALARAIDRLTDQPALARTLGREGRGAAIARFSPAAVAARYAAIYAATLAARAG